MKPENEIRLKHFLQVAPFLCNMNNKMLIKLSSRLEVSPMLLDFFIKHGYINNN